jgi:hypothetical protein
MEAYFFSARHACAGSQAVVILNDARDKLSLKKPRTMSGL